jgi:hypothetical protein
MLQSSVVHAIVHTVRHAQCQLCRSCTVHARAADGADASALDVQRQHTAAAAARVRNDVDMCLQSYTQLDMHTVRYADSTRNANGAAASPPIAERQYDAAAAAATAGMRNVVDMCMQLYTV